MARMPAHVLALLLLLPIAAIAADPPTLTEEHLRFRQQSAARDEARLRGFLAANEGELATTAGEVLARHHAATGGLEAWRAVESLKMTFRGGAGSSELVLERCYRRPDLYRQEVVGSPGASVSDGERVWRQGPDGSWSEAPSNGYRWFGGLDVLALDPDDPGVSYELAGVEMVNREPCYHVAQVWDDDERHELYFSIASGRLVERLTDYLSGPSWFSYWDYREVDGGLWLPHVRIRSVGDLGPPHGVVLESVEVDPELPDAFFGPAAD